MITKPFTLGGLLSHAAKTPKLPRAGKLPASRGASATLKLLRLPLSKVRLGPGF
jgi:hypothetical protein